MMLRFEVLRMEAMKENTWNGSMLTRIRTVTTVQRAKKIPTTAKDAILLSLAYGTQVNVITNNTSPYMSTNIGYKIPKAPYAMTDFGDLQNACSPFRATLIGVADDIEEQDIYVTG